MPSYVSAIIMCAFLTSAVLATCPACHILLDCTALIISGGGKIVRDSEFWRLFIMIRAVSTENNLPTQIKKKL
jgi:hypothetical protein